ncbi:MAG: hypothetical protein HYX81_05425, partial [Chloroflexi bacterium]|nr:hypothetical protein [Chloroflexota bacterium]
MVYGRLRFTTGSKRRPPTCQISLVLPFSKEDACAVALFEYAFPFNKMNLPSVIARPLRPQAQGEAIRVAGWFPRPDCHVVSAITSPPRNDTSHYRLPSPLCYNSLLNRFQIASLPPHLSPLPQGERRNQGYQETKTEILELKQRLVGLLNQAAAEAQKLGKLPQVALPEATIERPQNPEHGDYASGFPMKLARATRANPMKIAQDLVGLMTPYLEVEKIVVAPPGFINFTLKSRWLTNQVESLLAAGEDFGNIDIGKGSNVQVEFVSINP